MFFNVSPEAKNVILKSGYEAKFGGRSIRRTVEHLIADPLTNLLSADQVKSGDVVNITASADKRSLVFTVVAAELTLEEQFTLYRKVYGNDIAPPYQFKKADGLD
ncbi:MAG: hypothetical protein SGI74_03790 [Oligoflexia bacterium]|nr:hypothetical protein [Oligoflexia bacterium]